MSPGFNLDFSLTANQKAIREAVLGICGQFSDDYWLMSMGGMGYAKEYHVERYLREVLIPRIASVSPHMIQNFLSEKVPNLPKTY